MQELSPNGETNFWTFYLQNQETIDNIIYASIKNSRLSTPDVEDLKQDVLLAMDRCQILDYYDAKKGTTFGTYITGIIRGYVLHWFEKQQKPIWRPYPTTEDRDEHNALRFRRVYYRSFNGMLDDDLEDTPIDVSVASKIEEEYSLKETVRVVRKSLPKSLCNIFNYLVKGYSKTEIANDLKVSIASVSINSVKIKTIGKKALSD